MSEFVFLNDEIIPADRAQVSVFDGGFTHAAGLFETLRSYNGSVMRLGEHVQRMKNSSAQLEMNIPIDTGQVESAIDRVLTANGLLDARIRIVATPGNVPRPGQPSAGAPQPTLLITATQVLPYPEELYRFGMRVCISPYRQNKLDPIAGHKTLAYLPRLIAMKEAADRKCQEALWFTTQNQLAEGCVCNVFLVKDGEVLTPPLDTPILPGTTRNSVIELAKENGINLREVAINIEALLAAQEVFLTGSVLEIMPVTAIEQHVVGEGAPGPTTSKLQALYRQLVAKECELG